jgi:hypothetical protein
VSSWWGAGGLKRRAVSAVTDTRAELFVFRKEEVEVRSVHAGLPFSPSNREMQTWL